MRSDGRTPDRLRQVRITRDYLKHAEGSVLIEMGDTRVVCAVSVEEKVPPFLKNTGRAVRVINYSKTPDSYHFLDPGGIIETCVNKKKPDNGPKKGDLVILLDLGNYGRLGKIADFLVGNDAGW